MGELIKIADFLGKKYFCEYIWALDVSAHMISKDWEYVKSLEDSHGYQKFFDYDLTDSQR
jgi:hypothetical protein